MQVEIHFHDGRISVEDVTPRYKSDGNPDLAQVRKDLEGKGEDVKAIRATGY
ncbi:hypothetical protein [Vibrio owensii]|uniref:hypothetical protein n=1 Tax=Vibrio harveyi group TaxID=717610 RepID=UPI003CC6144E